MPIFGMQAILICPSPGCFIRRFLRFVPAANIRPIEIAPLLRIYRLGRKAAATPPKTAANGQAPHGEINVRKDGHRRLWDRGRRKPVQTGPTVSGHAPVQGHYDRRRFRVHGGICESAMAVSARGFEQTVNEAGIFDVLIKPLQSGKTFWPEYAIM